MSLRSTMKHTPGPWNTFGFNITASGLVVATTLEAGNLEEQKCNAKLMAAAPDLYIFCKLALKRLPKNCAGLIAIGKEAIKKAEAK